MLTVHHTPEGDDVPPECRATVARIQTVLDGGAAPGTREDAPAPAQDARPIRFDEAVANTEQVIRDTPRPFMESVSVAPKVFDLLTGPFKTPADPMASALAPTRKSLAEIPAAARA